MSRVVVRSALLAAAVLWGRAPVAQTVIERLTASEGPSPDTAGVGKAPAQADGERPRLRFRRDESLGRHSVGVAVGQTFLQDGLGNKGIDGMAPGFYYNYVASHTFDLLVNLHSWTFEKKDGGGKVVSKAETAGLAVGIKARLFQFDSFSLFGLGGPGFYRPAVHDADWTRGPKDSESQTVFGLHAGGGAELELNPNVNLAFILHIHDPHKVKEQGGRPGVSGWYHRLLLAGFYVF